MQQKYNVTISNNKKMLYMGSDCLWSAGKNIKVNVVHFLLWVFQFVPRKPIHETLVDATGKRWQKW